MSGKDYKLAVSLKGTTVSVSLDGQVVLGHVFNAVVVDGSFGLMADTEGSFDDVTVKTDDPAFRDDGDSLLASGTPGQTTDTALTGDELDAIVHEAISRLTQAWQLSDEEVALLNSVNFEIVDLDGSTLGYTGGTTVQIDLDAAGIGWFVDITPSDDDEFIAQGDGSLLADPTGQANGGIDLLTVVMHELGHILGLEDVNTETSGGDLMAATLAPGVRQIGTAAQTQPEPSTGESVSTEEPEPLATQPESVKKQRDRA
jgi:hypothetical protein